jgi:hypothetical protein
MSRSRKRKHSPATNKNNMASASQGESNPTKPVANNSNEATPSKADNFDWDNFETPSSPDHNSPGESPEPPKADAFDWDSFESPAIADALELEEDLLPQKTPEKPAKSGGFDFDEFELDRAEFGSFADFETKPKDIVPATPAPIGPTAPDHLEFTITVEDGWLFLLENASMNKIVWVVSVAVGLMAAVAVGGVVYAITATSPADVQEIIIPHMLRTGWILTLAAAIGGFSTSLFLWKNIAEHLQIGTNKPTP